MSTFTAAELEYLRNQPLGRLATVGRDGSPHVVPVGFRLSPDEDAIDIGGHGVLGARPSQLPHRRRLTFPAVWARQAGG